ncbi:unnamed protein product [Fusarium venenatum]|uniref:Uncharacterized protein n=1 Tax=Fusarium venenatum TaxID=56646 RepID=A0A2L2T894_9HYPO|nr:uncharacterized protein FVRRES_05867 [Fusarium venenatum]CEI61431.1 unnamed protein product [Fusarium venenatum]
MEDRDTHFTLHLPCLAILDIPQELNDRLIAFLWKYPYDPIALNDALQAVLVHERISKAFNYESEAWACGAVDGQRELKNPVPKVDIAQFVIYWPHYKRYHEEKRVYISGAHQYFGPFVKDLKPTVEPERYHHRPGSIAEALREFRDPGV